MFRRPTKVVTWSLASLLMLLGAARVVAPYFVIRYVNQTLDDLEGYTGHVRDLDLSLWRGAYTIKDVEISKRSGKVPVPLFSAPIVDLSVQWKALFHGAIVAEIDVYRPKVNFVTEAPTQGHNERTLKQTKVASNWQDQVKKLVPFKINHVAVHDGDLHFRNFYTSPKVDIYVQRLDAELLNLSNARNLHDQLASRAIVSGLAMHSGNVALDARFAPYALKPTFDLNAKLEHLQLAELNPFLEGYASIDAEAGTFSAYTQLICREGRFHGYVKPLLEHAQFLNWRDKQEDIFHKVWEAAAEVTKDVLENPVSDDVGLQIPLRGEIEDPNPDLWRSMVSLLRNAFIRALQHGFDEKLARRSE